MSVLFWNCQGLGQPCSVQGLLRVVRKERPLLVFLSETRKTSSEMEVIRCRVGFSSCLAVSCVGRKGGLAMLWSDELNVRLLSFSGEHIDVEVDCKWRCTGFYGNPITNLRGGSWSRLVELSSMYVLPWLVGGDFNEILCVSEKWGGRIRPAWQIEKFRRAIDVCDLQEVIFSGPGYTWCNRNFNGTLIYERLDRCLANAAWMALFPEAMVMHLVSTMSDHLPLCLHLSFERVCNLGKRAFRFENFWSQSGECGDIISQTWDPGVCWEGNVSAIQKRLQVWSKHEFGYLNDSIRERQQKLESLLLLSKSDRVISRIRDTEIELKKLLDCQETLWRQRSKVQWYVDGDRNTSYFHAFASNRRRNNRIKGLCNADGDWETTQSGLSDIVMAHFSEVFSSSSLWESDIREVTKLIPTRVSEEMKVDLGRAFSREDVELALRQINPRKSPGPDGLNAFFYQKFWHVIRDSVCSKVLAVLNNEGSIDELGHTNIVLIPKVKAPTHISEYRPISLCNVIYKLISKCIVNRLKSWLPSLVSENQSAFIAGRSVQDNMLIAFEMVHSLQSRKKGREGSAAIKLDIRKAYDKLEWAYIQGCLRGLGFDEAWVNLMMKCVTNTSYSVLLNGTVTGVCKPSRGLRQGDPLSPILYVLCTEGLSCLIEHKINKNLLSGMSMCRNGLRLSHLLFADDSLLFLKASEAECFQIVETLEDYARASGQEVNFEKSSILFSANVVDDMQAHLKGVLGINMGLENENYLGLPIIIGRKRAASFSHITERFRSKLSAWKGKLLSAAGKDVLIKAVLQSIPTYLFSIFKIPRCLSLEMESICAQFFWGASSGVRKIHWLSWSSLCRRRQCGGLGFRRIEAFNLALLAKHGWRFLSKEQSLAYRMLKQKYFPRSSFLKAVKKQGASYLWSGILEARKVLIEGGRWRVGDGFDVSIYDDKWLQDCDSTLANMSTFRSPLVSEVYELIDASRREWKTDLIESLFCNEIVTKIKATPLAATTCSDQWIWCNTMDGVYSVKSGYHVAEKVLFAMNQWDLVLDERWTRIWQVDVPPKFRFFAWRLCNGALASKVALGRRGVSMSTACDTCGEGEEDLIHIFRDCRWSRSLWAQFPSVCLLNSGTDFASWLDDCFSSFDAETLKSFVVVCWWIWRNRNACIFDGACARIQSYRDKINFWIQSQSVLGDAAAGNQVIATITTSGVKWKAPDRGCFKINFDASFSTETLRSHYGCVVRDYKGKVVVAESGFAGLVESVLHAEAVAASKALSLGVRSGVQRFLIEGDNLELIQQLIRLIQVMLVVDL